MFADVNCVIWESVRAPSGLGAPCLEVGSEPFHLPYDNAAVYFR